MGPTFLSQRKESEQIREPEFVCSENNRGGKVYGFLFTCTAFLAYETRLFVWLEKKTNRPKYQNLSEKKKIMVVGDKSNVFKSTASLACETHLNVGLEIKRAGEGTRWGNDCRKTFEGEERPCSAGRDSQSNAITLILCEPNGSKWLRVAQVVPNEAS